MNNFYLIQILGFIVFIIEILIILCKTKKKILFLNFLSNVVTTIEYFFMGAYSGLVSNLVTFVRNYVFNYYNNKKKKAPIIWLILILLFLIVVQLNTYDGIITIIPLITISLYTYSIWQDNIKKFKLLNIIIYFLSTIYYFYYLAYVNCISNIIFLIIAIINIKKTRKS